jgi:hypothetical protein
MLIVSALRSTCALHVVLKLSDKALKVFNMPGSFYLNTDGLFDRPVFVQGAIDIEHGYGAL